MGMIQVANSSFNARGLPMPALVISLLRSFAVGIPLAIIGDIYFGYIGVFASTAVCNVLIGVVAWQWNKASVTRQSAGWPSASVAA